MSDNLQLAIAPKARYGEHPLVQAAATHALVLQHYYVPNDSWLALGQLAANPNAYPLGRINNFFAALRISTGQETGYSQLLFRPIGWASDYIAHLQPLLSTTVRAYPPAIESRAWDAQVAVMTREAMSATGRLFQKRSALTDGNKNPRFALALQRLNSCFLRNNDEDVIIDAVITLEALLSDTSQEMTHKVAMRLAALTKLERGSKTLLVAKEAKRVYEHRSAVVHGDVTKAAKTQQIERNGGSKVRTVDVAMDHLRTPLRLLAEYPQYLDVQRIDAELLLGVPISASTRQSGS